MATRNQILKYALLPGIIPRIAGFFRSGFVHLTYMIAIIYGNVGLLPPNHPYLMPENIGRYGIRHVIAEAANNLVFSRKHIDQIIIFFIILTGLILLALQFILLVTAVMAEQPAYALGVLTPQQLFENPNPATGSAGPAQDIAFIILDRVFGITGLSFSGHLFNSCISDLGTQCEDMNGNPLSSTPTAYPFPFHIALHRMLWFYSMGIFWVGVSVIIYFVIAIVAETAQSGTPFGQRFNKAWAPVRFMLFFALIIPLNTGSPAGSGGRNEGLNAAQLITFYIVKMGSNFATNGWTFFNGVGTASIAPTNNYMSQQRSIVAQPNIQIQDVNDLIQAVHVARTCAAGYNLQGANGTRIDAYLIRSPVPNNIPTSVNGPALTPNAILLTPTGYTQATDFNYQGNIIIRFGRLALANPDPAKSGLEDKYEYYKGNVKPYCGDITIQVQGTGQPGADTIFEGYYNALRVLWNDFDIITRAECEAKNKLTNIPDCNPLILPDETFALDKVNFYRSVITNAVINGLNTQTTTGAFNLPPEIIERGWAGASLWYNRIAEMNGAVTTATLNIPKLSKLPLLMDIATQSNRQESANLNLDNTFTQNMADNLGINTTLNIGKVEHQILSAMIATHDFWVQEGGAHQSNFDKPTGNIIIDFINSVFGTNGIFEMRENTDVHPLAQLTAMGKGMMEATMRNVAYGAVLSGASSVISKADLGFTTEAMGKAAAKFFFAMAIATMGMSAVLYYVLPFLPFIYFIFAISGWVKSIFEAIVAMPLWALAHLRIDGEGIPGPGASNGYFLLLEIFLRPILIIFGFMASISIFSALVDVLNQVFDLIIANTGGYDNELEANITSGAATGFISSMDVSRGPVDEFFFTAMYVIICYLMGLACFKLVDLIPNNILRWMGVSITTFQENAQDPAGKLSSQVYRGSALVGNQLSGQMQGDLPLLTKFD